MTTDRKMPEGYYYEVPPDVTPEKLLNTLYIKTPKEFRIEFCRDCVRFLHKHGVCFIENQDDCYYFVKSSLEIPPEYKQWFPTDIGEL